MSGRRGARAGRVAREFVDIVAAGGARPTVADLETVAADGLGLAASRVAIVDAGAGPSDGWAARHPGVRTVVAPIVADGSTLGDLRVALRARGLPGPQHDDVREVADALSSLLALVRHGAAMADARSRSAALRASLWQARRAAVDAQDDERRRLERNLHDGVQHHLVALRIAAGAAEVHLAHHRTDDARQHLDTMAHLLDETDRALIRTADGSLPDVLVESGMVAAIAAEVGGSADVVIDETIGRRRYPLAIEATVYFACLEAVNNATKYAPHARIDVSLHATVDGIEWHVRDDGPGFDPGSLRPQSGLLLLRARVAAAGGELAIVSAHGEGSVVSGSLPF